MKVKVYKAKLTVEEKDVYMTKTVAKQFPVTHWSHRWEAARQGKDAPDPICKINGATLNSAYKWLLLVEDPEAGLVWTPPVEEKQSDLFIVSWWDDLERIPTVIL